MPILPAIRTHVTRRLLIVLLVTAARLPRRLWRRVGRRRRGGSGSTAPVASTADARRRRPTTGTTTSAQAVETVTVYFADSDATELEPETRSVPDREPSRGAGRARERPTEAGHQNALPAGTAIVGTDVQGGDALVNLSAEFTTGLSRRAARPPSSPCWRRSCTPPRPSTGVDRVRITVDGQTPSPTGSQYDWTGLVQPGGLPGRRWRAREPAAHPATRLALAPSSPAAALGRRRPARRDRPRTRRRRQRRGRHAARRAPQTGLTPRIDADGQTRDLREGRHARRRRNG